jgi:hypothetical protein
MLAASLALLVVPALVEAESVHELSRLADGYGKFVSASAKADARSPVLTATAAPAPEASAQPLPGGYTEAQIAEMINNPLGYLWLLNVQNTTTWFSGRLVDRAKQLGSGQNSTLIQPVLSMQLTPGLRWLSRPIVPINSFELPSNYTTLSGAFGPTGGSVSFSRTTGLGDIQWMNYVATNECVKPPDIFGLGFGLMMKTATSEVLGTGKWSVGPAAVAVHLGETWMYGVIAQQFWSFAGDPGRKDINVTALQPIIRYALTKESGIGVMPNWNYNWEASRWTQLFVGLGYDAMVNLGPVPTQVGIEFHYNLAKNDLLNPQWQLRVVLTPVVPAPAWAARPLFGGG